MKKTDYDNDNELKVNYTPKFPSDSSDFVAVGGGAWKDEMVGYLSLAPNMCITFVTVSIF